MSGVWRLANGRSLTLDRPRVLAIVNRTPDSFSDGGELTTLDAAIAYCEQAREEGADALDIGGESTRPGSQAVPAEEQIERVAPLIRALRDRGISCPISVDTTRAAVARAALDAGADAVNDVSGGLDDPDMLALVAEREAGVILMHRLVAPEADRYSHQHPRDPQYDAARGGVVGVVREFLAQRAAAALDAGVAREAIVLDPGLGFGKSVEQNYALIREARRLGEQLGFPLLSAASRKSFVGVASGAPESRERTAGSVAISVAHALAGLRLFRVHDVRAHAQALRVATRIAGLAPGPGASGS